MLVPILSLLVVLSVSLLVVRVATVALVLTGISRPLAQFQARSAFTGVGFTTSESERIVNHPVRRRIIMLLMLMGNAGIVTTVAALIAGLVGVSESGMGTIWWRLALLVAGLTAIWGIAYSPWVDRWLSRLTVAALRKWTTLNVRDYATLLHLAGEYGISELQVQEGDWLAGRSLTATRLADEGILVLGVRRPDGTYLGAPRGNTEIRANDVLLVYGRAQSLKDLDSRRPGFEGHIRHVEAIEKESVERDKQQEMDERSKEGQPVEQAKPGD